MLGARLFDAPQSCRRGPASQLLGTVGVDAYHDATGLRGHSPRQYQTTRSCRRPIDLYEAPIATARLTNGW
jgi:hypothetical protein